MPSGIVTLLSDFGTKDPFVGVMKGVISSRFPQATLIDLAHGVAAQDVVEGAFWLERTFRWFPAGTVHLAVVDPGVGSSRAAIALFAHGHFFVGPDNGLLAGVADGGEARELDPDALDVVDPSPTFHGRDVFAPAAAELARGRPFSELGAPARLAVGRLVPLPRSEGAVVHGVVVSIDRFGNAITNIGRDLVPARARVRAHETDLPLVGTYSDLEPGSAGAVLSSFDTVEIACRDGDAASVLRLARGSAVTVMPADRAAARR
jgi:S-adenosyl-L-methionine hydrolase (adenosine-forming)